VYPFLVFKNILFFIFETFNFVELLYFASGERGDQELSIIQV